MTDVADPPRAAVGGAVVNAGTGFVGLRPGRRRKTRRAASATRPPSLIVRERVGDRGRATHFLHAPSMWFSGNADMTFSPGPIGLARLGFSTPPAKTGHEVAGTSR
jgi:hypothetical protein